MKQNKEKNQTALPTQAAVGIQNRIMSFRGRQVLLDRDLAMLYGVSTRALNQAVKRNANRFPEGFAFRLSKDENDSLKSQTVISNESSKQETPCLKSQTVISNESSKQETPCLKSQIVISNRGGMRYCPYAFTEHGVVMLASLLKSTAAIEASVRIVNAFVAMRRFILGNAQVFQRLEIVEQRQIATDDKVNDILNRLNTGEIPPQGVFYDGQLWDACSLLERLIARASKSILLIDSWVGPETLDMLAKKGRNVTVKVVTSARGKKIAPSDLAKFNAQYGGLTVKTSVLFHDRFLILDNKELYLIGASLKDLGKKCFGFTKMDAVEIAAIRART